MQILGKVIVVIPPLTEQDAILTEWQSESKGIAKAERGVRHEISLLREYRTRLVADVVTGKVDVRAAAATLFDEADEPNAFDDNQADADRGEETTDGDLDATPEEAEA